MTSASRPSVSVVIPAWNAVRFLPAALDSVRQQTYGAAEILVVDDGSTDGTAEIARRAADVVLLESPQSGPSAARNLAVDRASGEVVAFLDADDLWLPEKLEKQIAALAAEPAAGLCLCQEICFVEEGKPLPPWARPHLLEPHTGLLSTTIVRRQALDDIGPFDESMRQAEDLDWFSRAESVGARRIVVEEVLVRKRLHEANATAKSDTNREAMLKMARKAMLRRRGQSP
ncbi:MAG: glycosyltransferase family A protein [Acidobacteriota bacterium]